MGVKIMKDLADLATFLNEKNDKNGQFLKTLDKFRKQFIFTMKQCEEREKREEEKKKREQWKANKKSSISKQNNASIKPILKSKESVEIIVLNKKHDSLRFIYLYLRY